MIARQAALAALAAAAVTAVGCGGSEKPAYCADRSALQQSLADLGNVQSIGALETQLKQVQSDANALVRSAREDFGPETSALRSALTQLESSARAAVANPSTQSASAVAADVSGVTSAFNDLSHAVSSHC